MRLTLPSLLLAPVLAASAALTPHTANAAVLHVPFAFTVGGQTMPAGDYNVNRRTGSNFVQIASRDFSWHRTYIVGPGDASPDSHAVALRFDTDEKGYQLRSIEYAGLCTSRLDKKTRQTEDRPVHVIRGE